MKAITPRLFWSALALLCWAGGPLSAQNQAAGEKQIIIISSVEREDGTTEHAEHRLKPGEDAKVLLQQMQENLGEKSEWHLFFDEKQIPAAGAQAGEEVFFFRSSKQLSENQDGQPERLQIFMHGEPLSQEERFQRGYDTPARWSTEPVAKAFLGLYPAAAPDGVGVKLDGTTPSGPAQAAGLQRGDILLSVAGHAVNGPEGLRNVMSTLEPGETVPVRLRRDGQEMEKLVELGSQRVRRWAPLEVKREPCQVFIGVYSSNHSSDARGVRVTGVIADTPAEAAGIQKGDIILAMDGIAVNSHEELLAERNKHQPGEAFVLKALRDGHEMRIEARFTTCEPEPEAAPAPQEAAPAASPELPQIPAPELPDNSLELEEYKAFPNPAFSYFNLQFRAAPVPTQIQLADVNGRVVFQRQLNRFDGYFNEEILLNDAAPGLLTLTIRQGDKVVSKQVLLLNRA